MRAFFVQPVGYTLGMRVITACGALFGILHLVAILASNIIPAQSFASSAIYLMALALYWWAISANRRLPLSAAFSPDLPKHLNESGPYRFIRHPFYCSYLLTWIGGVVASGQLWLLVTVAIMLIIYIRAANEEEEKFSKSPLASEYNSYRSRTGQLMPNPFKLLFGRAR